MSGCLQLAKYRNKTADLLAPDTRTGHYPEAYELRRLKTGWPDRVSSVTLESESLPSLLFDNLAYSAYLRGEPARP